MWGFIPASWGQGFLVYLRCLGRNVLGLLLLFPDHSHSVLERLNGEILKPAVSAKGVECPVYWNTYERIPFNNDDFHVKYFNLGS